MNPKLRSITLTELENLQIDEEWQLYWKGKKIVIQKKISLEMPEFVATVAIAIGTLLTGIDSLVNIVHKL